MSLTITYFGHSGFLIDNGSHAIVIDPFLTGNPVAKHKPEDVRCTAIALTHGHADHFGDCEEIAKRNNATIFAAFEICEYLESKGFTNTESMGIGGKVVSDFGFVALTPALHSSSYEGAYMGMPAGVIVRIGETTIYHCGDTGLFSDMKLISEIYQPDIAMIPIGDRFTMGPDLAKRAAELIRPKVAIPIHYNTWPPIAQDPARFKPSGMKVQVMEAGDVFRL